jgi:hypothetical protein
MRGARTGVAAVYVLLVVAAFADIYVSQRSATASEVVDATPVVLLLALLAFVVGLAIQRWWAVLLPCAAVPCALAVAAAQPDRTLGSDRGLGDWVAFAGLVPLFGCVAAAAGVGAVALARVRLARPSTAAARRRARGFLFALFTASLLALLWGESGLYVSLGLAAAGLGLLAFLRSRRGSPSAGPLRRA